MLEKEPKLHWSFKVHHTAIDVPRILKEAAESGGTCVVVSSEFRDGTRYAIFIRKDTPDWATVAGQQFYGFRGIQEGAHFKEDGLDAGHAATEAKIEWCATQFEDPMELAKLVTKILMARHWRTKKHRVKVVGL